MTRTLAQFAADCGGRLVGADRPWEAVSTDTRRICAGELFVALRGPNFDGADFLPQAAAAGASAADQDERGEQEAGDDGTAAAEADGRGHGPMVVRT